MARKSNSERMDAVLGSVASMRAKAAAIAARGNDRKAATRAAGEAAIAARDAGKLAASMGKPDALIDGAARADELARLEAKVARFDAELAKDWRAREVVKTLNFADHERRLADALQREFDAAREFWAGEVAFIGAERKRKLARMLNEDAATLMRSFGVTENDIQALTKLTRRRDLAAAKADELRAGAVDARRMTTLEIMVARSDYLTGWHLRAALALRDTDDLSAGKGGASGVSGTAGDGAGGEITGRGESHWGAIGVPQPSAHDDLSRFATGQAVHDKRGRKRPPPRTFKPRAVGSVRRVHDGGMAAMADRAAYRDRMWAIFIDAAEAAGRDEVGRVGFGKVCAGVIRGELTGDEGITRFVKMRKNSDTREAVQIAMAIGLEAVAGPLGLI